MTDRPSSTERNPVLLRVAGPPGSGKSLLIVALTSALRQRGYRVGSAEARIGLDGTTATVLTTGSGARVTLPGAIEPGELTSRAAVLDPALDLLLAEGYPASGDRVPAVEIIEEGSAPLTPPTELLAVLTREQLARAFAARGPADDLGLAAVIEERLLTGRADGASLARAAETPIESARHLLERPHLASAPSPPRARGWRRWLGG